MKQFYGFNNREEAERAFSKEYLDDLRWKKETLECKRVLDASV